MTKLDEIAINIELVLISLIEGVALVTLAEHSVDLLQGPEAFWYLPYILSGLLIILVFWAQSIMHALSFIRWPLNMWHMFLYFFAAFLQIVAYGAIEDKLMWFFWWTIFTLVGLGMYVLDLKVLQQMRSRLGNDYINKIEERHRYEMRVLIPAALVFNLAMLLLTAVFPAWFESGFLFALPAILQLLVSCVALYDCVNNFNARSVLIARIQD